MEQKNLWTWIIAGLLVVVIITAIIEGKVYMYGAGTYLVVGLIEVGIFLIGVLVGREMKKAKHRIR